METKTKNKWFSGDDLGRGPKKRSRTTALDIIENKTERSPSLKVVSSTLVKAGTLG